MHTVGQEVSFGGPANGWENNIKTKLVYMGCEDMDQIFPAQDLRPLVISGENGLKLRVT